MRQSGAVTYLHGDHLGSASLTTSASGVVAQQQEFDPWGQVRSGGITATSLNYTGQRLHGTGLLYYHARIYDPALARFVSADSIMPGSASGSSGGAATLGMDGSSQLAPLTVDFHKTGFVLTLNAENAFKQAKGFYFQLDGEGKRKAKSPFGSSNPQALNCYAYVLNNPLRYTDPTGHFGLTWDEYGYWFHLTHERATALYDVLDLFLTEALTWGAGKLAGLGLEGILKWLETALKPLGDLGKLIFQTISNVAKGAATAAALLAILGDIVIILKLADKLYGERGVDLYVSP